jgi:folate-binding protein YgfZ
LSARAIDRLPSRRLYSTGSPPSTITSSGLAPLLHRRLISLSGPDAAKFLQGLITNNVDTDRQTPFYAAFLDARGRVLWDVFIWVYPDLVAKEGWACYIEVDYGELDAIIKHLRRHKLRSKIVIAEVEEGEMSVWAAWGVPSSQLQTGQLLVSMPDPRGFGYTDFGTRCLVLGNQAPIDASAPVVDTRQYHIRRYLAGIPEGPVEIQRETALPMECNVDLSQGIDFRKGCYVGQELTIRTKHTGVVRKRILPVQIYTSDSAPDPASTSSNHMDVDLNWPPESTPEVGADIKQLDENGSVKKGRAAGKFIAAIGNVGLALCRLEMMTSMRVSAEGGSWKPGVEFGVQKESGETVKVQAVVSQGFRERERDVWDKARTRV